MTLPEDTILENRYRVDRLLAHGGMGAIYRGLDLKLNVPVALKENFFQTPQSIRQFQQEALILARLHHPGLPRVTDHFSFEGQQYLVMDFVEGQDLWQMVKEQGHPLEEWQALQYLIQVCDAVSYLHRQTPSIIHRDIKPQNIKITPQGQAVLVDFGIAKMADGGERTSTGAQGITPGFSPPEQYSGQGTTPLSDVYSLGATLYAILTGQKPPDSISLMTGGVQFNAPNVLNPRLSFQVSQTIMHAMQTRPPDRPRSVAAWQADLVAILAGETIDDRETLLPGTVVAPPIPPTGGVSLPSTTPFWLVDAAGRGYPLGEEPLMLGRHSDADVVINDPGISRHHALIRREGARCFVTDNGSANGTFLNGQRLGDDWYPIKPGDTLRLGSVQFSLTGQRPDQIASPPPPPAPGQNELSTDLGRGQTASVVATMVSTGPLPSPATMVTTGPFPPPTAARSGRPAWLMAVMTGGLLLVGMGAIIAVWAWLRPGFITPTLTPVAQTGWPVTAAAEVDQLSVDQTATAETVKTEKSAQAGTTTAQTATAQTVKGQTVTAEIVKAAETAQEGTAAAQTVVAKTIKAQTGTAAAQTVVAESVPSDTPTAVSTSTRVPARLTPTPISTSTSTPTPPEDTPTPVAARPASGGGPTPIPLKSKESIPQIGAKEVIDVDFNPKNPAEVYALVKRDGIYKSINGGNGPWARVNLDGGALTALIISPHNPTRIYAPTWNAVLRSDDGGNSWKAFSNGLSTANRTVDAVTIDPIDPNLLYAGIGATLVVSTDGGENWTSQGVGAGLGGGRFTSITVDPLNHDIVYAAGEFGSVYQSLDSARTFKQLAYGVGRGTYSLIAHPSQKGVYLAGINSFDAGIIKTDNGADFYSVSKGLIFGGADSAYCALVYTANPNIVYAGSGYEDDNNAHGIFKSIDGGQSWNAINNGLSTNPATGRPHYVKSIAVHPTNSDIVLAATGGGLYISGDGGASWSLR